MNSFRVGFLATTPSTNGHKTEFIDVADHHQETANETSKSNTPASTYVNAAFELDLAVEPPNSAQLDDQSAAHTWHGDDALVYANLSEIARRKELEDIDRQPYPPYPDASAQPLRIIANGWQEYRTMGGRSYYFHPETGICQWQPPRSTACNRFVFEENNAFCSQHECLASTSADGNSTEFPVEIPYRRELRKMFNNNKDFFARDPSKNGDTFGQNKGIMAHSLDSGISNDQQQVQQQVDVKQQSDSSSAHYDTPPNIAAVQHRDSAIRYGFLEKCKVSDNGVKLKRRDWSNSYVFLFTGHLLFYKDQKSAEKIGKHYPRPADVCDLRNASVSYAEDEKQKDKRRKHMISLVLRTRTEYLLCCNDEQIGSWLQAIRQAITSIPEHKLPSSTIISDYCGSLSRASLRNKRDSGPFASKTNFHNSIKSRLKSSSTSKVLSEDRMSVTESGSVTESSHPTKQSIIEKLLRFFRSRPSMESLRERGIYKPEPVFGSTLSNICHNEKTLVPKFITEVTRLIEEKGLDSDGLYRVNGNLSAVQKIRCQIDQDSYEALHHEEDIHVLTGALKLFFRELTEPIFPVSMHKDYMSAMRESGAKRLRMFDELLLKLPPINRETLRVLVQHLNRVATHSGKNRMQIHNLAIIFGPSLFCSEERPSSHLRKSSQDKGKGTRRKSSDKRTEEPTQSEPTQNLAYRMIMFGQAVEFILNEADRLEVLRSPMPQTSGFA